MGCIYHLGQDFGTKISNNICHNVESFGYGGDNYTTLSTGNLVDSHAMTRWCMCGGWRWGYYTDQASRGVLIEKNIAYDVKYDLQPFLSWPYRYWISFNIHPSWRCAAFHQHYGIENVLDNNVFAFVNDEDGVSWKFASKTICSRQLWHCSPLLFCFSPLELWWSHPQQCTQQSRGWGQHQQLQFYAQYRVRTTVLYF